MSAASYRVVYNVTDRPAVVDDEGRTVGGHEFGVAQTSSEHTKTGVAIGVLAEPDLADVDDSSDVNPAAKAAVDLAGYLEQRAERLGGLSADALAAHLAAHADVAELEAMDRKPGDLTKRELVHAIAARTAIPLPAGGSRRQAPTEE